ncbi:MAG: metal-dependent hydrolase [Thiotrichales bacterium]|nr:MAG: metal-dependent hydrolase [Thiotrichales bacterium]
MDSITQLALGAAVGEATAGRQVGRRALLWGAIAGTIPDLDVFIPLGDAVSDFTYHRSFSHSLFVLAALTPFIVWLILKLHPDTAEHRKRWYALVYLVFATHVLLDSFTVYGTQIFWPVLTTPMTWSTIFIIDPLYTLPLLIGIIAALVVSRRYSGGHTANSIGLILSTGYLVWTLGAKLHVEYIARSTLANQNLADVSVLTTPTPFNSLLWRILVVDDTHYYEGYYSIFDHSGSLRFDRYPRSLELVRPLHDHGPVQRLQWFTKDFYAAALMNHDIVITDLRMGAEPDYIFRFKVGQLGNPHPHATTVEQLPGIRNYERLHWIWARILEPQPG